MVQYALYAVFDQQLFDGDDGRISLASMSKTRTGERGATPKGRCLFFRSPFFFGRGAFLQNLLLPICIFSASVAFSRGVLLAVSSMPHDRLDIVIIC